MKRFLPFLIVASLLIFACENEPSTDSQTKSSEPTSSIANSEKPQTLPAIPPVVEEAEETDRNLGQSELKDASINQAGFQLNLKLPPGASVQAMPGNTKALMVNAEDGSFQIVISAADIATEDLISLWQDRPPVGKFRQFIVNGRGGVLAEVEREGKADYHVDYIFEKYRLHTPFDKSFSRMQATKIFNVCRQIQGINR
ncbi:MAG: hypothetical protein AAF927_02860 [Bacteroidota bacterium]